MVGKTKSVKPLNPKTLKKETTRVNGPTHHPSDVYYGLIIMDETQLS
jgi:hypothetical protein